MNCQSVTKGNAFRKTATKALLMPFKQPLNNVTKPKKLGVGKKAGGSQLIFGVQLIVEATPHFVVITLDIKNAFNEVKRTTMLD